MSNRDAKHSNIAIFVPHIGCKHQCSFCNQRYITGQDSAPSADDVENAVKTALQSPRYDKSSGQIAFFGGSFTAIKRDYMLELLSAAKRQIDLGFAVSIRISTRPDCIDDEVLSLLKIYGVKSIELGAQSMCDDVLILNERGHTAADVENASRLIKSYGFELGLQMMTGLYGDTDEKAVMTAEKIIALRPKTARIYPTVVLENTRLCELYREDKYTPQTVDEAAALGAKLISMFMSCGIDVIRFGLHTINEEKYVAGPWHPALAELAYAKIYMNIMLKAFESKPFGRYIISVNPTEISKTAGQKKCNLEMLRKMGYNCKIRSADMPKYTVTITREE